MDDEIKGMLLSGITEKEFMVLYLVGLIGFTVRFLAELWAGIRFDRSTPYKFQWRYFAKGGLRMVISMIVLAFVIARFQEFSHYLVDIEFPQPTRVSEGNEPIASIAVGGAFIVGLGLDEIVKRVVKVMANAAKKR